LDLEISIERNKTPIKEKIKRDKPVHSRVSAFLPIREAEIIDTKPSSLMEKRKWKSYYKKKKQRTGKTFFF
jgi:hypothetical protein